jgi:hypothetical protein
VDLQPQPLSILLPQRPDGQLARIIDRIERLLPAFRIEVLAEISLTVEQPTPTTGTPRSLAAFI